MNGARGSTAMSETPGKGDGTVEARVRRIFLDALQLDVEVDTDVIGEGLLDSLGFVQLLVELEGAFGITVDIAELDLDDFGSVARIARYVEAETGSGPVPEPRRLRRSVL